MELRLYARIVWRWLWLIILAMVCGGAAALLAGRWLPVSYKASTALVVRADADRSQSLYDVMLVTDRLSRFYAELPSTRPVLEATVAALGLPLSPDALAGKVKVTLNAETMLLTLTVEDSDPQRAAAIANMIVQVMQQQGGTLLGSRYRSSRASLGVVEPALPPRHPVQVGQLERVLLGVIAGLLVAGGIVVLAEFLDDRLRTPADIQRRVQAPLLAVIRFHRGWGVRRRLPVLTDPYSATAEAYRLLREHVLHGSVQAPLRSLVISSAGRSEGKSSVAANLAVALAQSGRRVILVDGDLRQGRLHALFGLHNGPGLAAALLFPATPPEQLWLETGITNLRLLPAGKHDAGTVDLLTAPQLVSLMQALEASADIVICDSPALLATADPIALGRVCTATLLVAYAGRTRWTALEQALERLRGFQPWVLGVVLTAAPRSEQAAYRVRGKADLIGVQRAELAPSTNGQGSISDLQEAAKVAGHGNT